MMPVDTVTIALQRLKKHGYKYTQKREDIITVFVKRTATFRQKQFYRLWRMNIRHSAMIRYTAICTLLLKLESWKKQN